MTRFYTFLLFYSPKTQSAPRKKSSERTEPTNSANVNFEEEDLVPNMDEGSDDEGETNKAKMK